jgi:hypothetical protein
MIVRFDIDYINFMTSCNVLIAKVPRATKRLMLQAGAEILANSNVLVPKETLTLMSSGYYEVAGRSATDWDLTVGYADVAHDQQNPKSGKMASEYVVVVHEDLLAYHPLGEAKFLEKAFLQWVTRFPRVAKAVLKELGL